MYDVGKSKLQYLGNVKNMWIQNFAKHACITTFEKVDFFDIWAEQ